MSNLLILNYILSVFNLKYSNLITLLLALLILFIHSSIVLILNCVSCFAIGFYCVIA